MEGVASLLLISLGVGLWPLPVYGEGSRPSIVFILTDDQDVRLGSLDVMHSVRSLITDNGLYFNNAFVTTPICCPSRSSILTGKYVHNHHTYSNVVERGCDAPSWRTENEHKTMGYYMHQAGYNTALFGKYLNQYGYNKTGVGLGHIPPGWHHWYGLVGNSKYYNYTVSNNGTKEVHIDNYTLDYFTDVLARQAVSFIHDSAGPARDQDMPLFMYIATPSPHRPATPAPQYANKFSDWKAPRTASFAFRGLDKHWLISKGTDPLNTTRAEMVDFLYQQRLASLLSVDDLVTDVVTALEEENLISNTYIFFSSDHGYHLGQFSQQGEKKQPYDENIRVPLIVRGPGVHPKASTDTLALSIDLAPTFLDLAGYPVPPDMDGLSLKSVLLGEEGGEAVGGSQFLIEYFAVGKNVHGETVGGCMTNDDDAPMTFLHDCYNDTYIGVRVLEKDQKQDLLFVEFFQNSTVPMNASQIYFSEYYDMTQDNWQLKNAVKSLPSEQLKYFQDTVWDYHLCSGASCHKLRRKH